MARPLPKLKLPLIPDLNSIERSFLAAVIGAFPSISATGAARASGIRDPTLALGRAQTMLRSQSLIHVLQLTVGQEAVETLCQQVGLDAPPLAPIPGFTSTASPLDGSGDIADAEERKRFWTVVMNDPDFSPADRLRASDLLAKAEGDYKGTEDTPVGDDLVSLLERLEAKDDIVRQTETLQLSSLVLAGAIPEQINLAALPSQLHAEWFRADGSIRIDRPRRRVVIETIPATEAQVSEATNGTDAAASVDHEGKPPVPSMTHHMKASKPKPGATLAGAYRLPETTS